MTETPVIPDETFQIPAWWTGALDTFNDGIAHVFLLHWAVNDSIALGIDLKAWIELSMVEGRDCVVFYSRSSGFTFGNSTDAERWKEQFLLAAGLAGGGPGGMPGMPGMPQMAKVDPLAAYREPGGALPLLDRALRQDKVKLCVVVDFAESIVPDADWGSMSAEDRTALVTMLTWAKDEIGRHGHPIFLITRNQGDVHHDLRAASSGIHAVEIPNPDTAQRLEYITTLTARVEESFANEERETYQVLAIDDEEFARLSAGLQRRHLEDVFLKSRRAQAPITAEMVKLRKKEIIASEFGETIEIWDPEHGFEVVGGMDYVKEFFRKNVIDPLRAGNIRRVPKGVLMIGPPGTGKSLVARAVAKESGLNCLKFDPSKIFGQYVGQSERNLRRALQAILSNTPCIVFVDELDQQGVSRDSGGDGGVSGRVFGMMIDFMAEESHRGQIVWLGASNRPDLVDAAMKRPGRFDRVIPFLPPSDQERKLVLDVLCSRNRVPATAETLAETAQATPSWTQAELEALVVKVLQLLEDRNPDVFNRDATSRPLHGGWVNGAFRDALAVLRPTTGDIQFQTLLALRECNDLDLLPAHYRDQLTNRDALEEQIEEQELKHLDRPRNSRRF